MSSQSRNTALRKCLAALRDGRPCGGEIPADELIRQGYALPADGELKITMHGLSTLWRLRDCRVAETVGA